MRRISLRRQLFVLALVGVLPLAVLAGAGLAALFEQRREDAQSRALEITRALATAVHAELQRSLSTLAVLAASASLQHGDIDGFDASARRAAATQPQWHSLILSLPSGEPVLSTRAPRGEKLPALVEPESFQAVVRSREPRVGTIAKGTQRFAIALRMPVMKDGELRYVLTAVADPTAFLEILRRQHVPEDWVISVFDARGMRVARSRDNQQHFGTPASESLREMMAAGGNEGRGITRALEGDRIFTAFTRLPESGWSVAIGLPVADVTVSAARSTAIYALAVALSILVGLIVAVVMAGRIRRATAQLRDAAHGLGEGRAVVIPETGIHEMQEVARAIGAAAGQRRTIEADREELLASERAARSEAEANNRAKDQFLAMLGHELRNPLAALSNASSLLGHATPEPRMAARAREVIQRQVAHLARLTDDLLDAARAILGKIELRLEPVDLAAVARQTLATFAAGARLERHHVVEDLQETWVRGDPVRLDQVVSNLLGNAIKYTPEGGTIWVRTRCQGEECVLSVADDGVGLAPELAARVFDLFVQGERNLDRAEGGLGIGLTLVRRLAELHQGSAQVTSDGPDRGAEFVVRFPAVERPARAELPERPSASRQVSVLLVEDNDDARETLAALLEVLGHSVRAVRDGEDGLAAALAQPPDVALIDLGLPRLDGFEVARRIRASGNDRTYLAALTGYGAREDRDRSLAAGFDTHVTKPIELPALQELLATAAAPRPRRAAG